MRESTQSWREVLLGLKQRGLKLAPKLGIGDGALGFWAAIEEVYRETSHQRCGVHKVVNILNYLPRRFSPRRRRRCARFRWPKPRPTPQWSLTNFIHTFRAKYPKATECLAKDREALLAFYDFPAEHWTHIRTSNVIESAFGTVRHRTQRTKGCVTRQTMLALVFKLGRTEELPAPAGIRVACQGDHRREVQGRDRSDTEIASSKQNRIQQSRRLINAPYTKHDNIPTYHSCCNFTMIVRG